LAEFLAVDQTGLVCRPAARRDDRLVKRPIVAAQAVTRLPNGYLAVVSAWKGTVYVLRKRYFVARATTREGEHFGTSSIWYHGSVALATFPVNLV